MKLSTSPRLLLCAIILAASSTLVHAQYTPNQAESTLWGQPDFTTANFGTTAGIFNSPTQVITDPATGKFFVVDTTNNRVLRFASSAAFINGAGADCVFGQSNFISDTPGLSNTGMNAPQGAVVDSGGRLWVADTTNNRVLRFDNAANASLDAGAIVADGVLGQLNFDSADLATPTQNGMQGPTGVAVDSSGSLYVVDKTNNRILKFTSAATKLPGALADGLLGQTNYLAATPGTTASTFSAPSAALIDSSDNLWLADTANNRVLFFATVSSLSFPTLGPSASKVLGQSIFTTAGAAVSTTGLTGPTGLSLDILGRLNVSDSSVTANRIVIFDSPTTLASGSAASFVLGQPNFTTGTPNTTQTGLRNPAGSVFASGQLFVADKGNHRIVSFTITPGTPSITPPGKAKLPTNKDRFFVFYIGNSSSAYDDFTVGLNRTAATKKLARLTFIYNGTDITSALLSNTFTTSLIGPSQLLIKVAVTPKRQAREKGGTIAFSVTMTSKTSASSTAQSTIKVRFKKPKKM